MIMKKFLLFFFCFQFVKKLCKYLVVLLFPGYGRDILLLGLRERQSTRTSTRVMRVEVQLLAKNWEISTFDKRNKASTNFETV